MRHYPIPDPAEGRRLFLDAIAASKQGRWEEAGRTLCASARAFPDHPLTASAMLECATNLARSGAAPSVVPQPSRPSATGCISVIVCSINPGHLARLKQELAHHLDGDDWELVHVDDARSLCEGYARGLQRSRGDLIVLCHDDIGILCDRFGARLREHLAIHDMIGVAGADKLNGPSWAWAGTPHTMCWVCQPHASGGFVLGLLGAYDIRLEGAQSMDGLFIAARRSALLGLGFDAQTFDGFHFYDMDLSWRAHLAGLRCAITPDIVLWHASKGSYDDAWKDYAGRFLEKFPDLRPAGPSGRMKQGGHLVHDVQLIPQIYAWIAHWLDTASQIAM